LVTARTVRAPPAAGTIDGMTKPMKRRPLLVGSALLLAAAGGAAPGCATPTVASTAAQTQAAPVCPVDALYTPQACGFVGVTRSRRRARRP
jgi:hypothetical protein